MRKTFLVMSIVLSFTFMMSVVGKYEAKIRVSRTRYRKIEVSKKRGGNGLVRLTPR